jgi:hypothetical protein
VTGRINELKNPVTSSESEPATSAYKAYVPILIASLCKGACRVLVSVYRFSVLHTLPACVILNQDMR